MNQRMIRLERAEEVRVDRAGAKGRGVYAARRFAQGEVIECVPVVVVPDCQREYVEESFLAEYMFQWDGQLAVALGFGAVYNHSYAPNARYVRRISDRRLDFVALRDIDASEEIVVNYNGDPTCTDRVWFEVIA